MLNNSYLTLDQWTEPVLASCYLLKWIGCYLCFVFLGGIALNGFVLYTTVTKKCLQSPISIFIVALAASDLLHALIGIPLPLVANLACRWLFGKYLCYFEGFIIYLVGMFGLYLLTALSLNRYWMIVIGKKTKQAAVQTAHKSVCFSLLGSLFWASAPLFGWNNYTLEGVRTSCSIHWQSRTLNVISYNILIFIFGYLIPLSIMIYCNARIYLKVRHLSHRRLSRKTKLNTFGTRSRRNIDSQIGGTVLLIILTFIIAWTPYAIAAFISSFFSPSFVSPLGGTLPAIFAKSSVCFNPLVYLISRSAIPERQTFKSTITPNSISTKEKSNRSRSVRHESFCPL